MKATFGYTLFVVGIGLVVSPLPSWVGGITIVIGICLAVAARNEYEAAQHRHIVDQIDAVLEQQRPSPPPQEEESEMMRTIRQAQERLRALNKQYLDDNGDDAA